MSAFLKRLWRSPQEGSPQELVARLGEERKALEQLVQRAELAFTQLQHLDGTTERVNLIESQIRSLESVIPKVSGASQRLTALSETEARLAGELERSNAEVTRLREEIGVLSGLAASTKELGTSLGGFLALREPFAAVRRDVASLESGLDAQRAAVARMRELQDVIQRDQMASAAGLAAIEEQRRSLFERLSEAEMRAAGVEQLLADLTPVTEGVAESRRQLATVKVVADQLAQKVALLEQQRDAVDRATGRLEQLGALAQRAEGAAALQAAQAERLAETAARLDGVAATQQGLGERSGLLVDQLQEMEAAMAVLRRDLGTMRESAERTTERFTLDRGSVAGLSQRLGDLRRGLSDAENRLASVADTGRAVDLLGARVEALASQTASATTALAAASELSNRVRSGALELERLDRLTGELQGRVERLQEARPAIDSALHDLSGLARSHEEVREALDQIRSTHTELGAMRGALADGGRWLEETQQRLAALRQEVAGLDRMRGTVDGLRQEVDRVTASLEFIEARRDTVDEVQRRLAEAATLGAAVEERGRGLHERLQSAEDRTGALLPRLDEVGRVGSQLVDLAAQLRDAEGRLHSARDGVAAVEARVGSLEALEERVRVLARETDQRQAALEQAAVHLEQASAFRREAAETAHALDERARQVNLALERASDQLTRVDDLWTTLDGRIADLRAVEERLAGFELRLREWEGTEAHLDHALEQAAARETTLATLQEQIRGVYQLAERTMSDAEAIAASQPSLQQARFELEAVLERLRSMDSGIASLEERRRQVTQAEERLAYAEAVLGDLQAAVESLVVQKAEVDYILEKTATLAFESRQAEALIDTLREERRVSDRVRGALSELRGRDRKEDSRILPASSS